MQQAMVIIIQVQQMTEYKDGQQWFIAKERSLAGIRDTALYVNLFIFLPQLKIFLSADSEDSVRNV